MRKYIFILLVVFSLGLFSCEKFREPAGENSLSLSQLEYSAAYSEGLLMRAYYALPSDYTFDSDVASDDAVTNDMSSSYRSMAVGGWKASYNPLETWSSSYTSIYYINKFMDVYKDVKWSVDSSLSADRKKLRTALYIRKFKGEASALRAYYKWRILQSHGGRTAGGTLLGFPIVDKVMSVNDDWKLPRAPYSDCVKSIFNDLDTAIKYLPATWFDRSTASGLADAVKNANADTNVVMGARYENRINGNIARALKARVALLAASPAFSDQSGVSWADAADIAGPLLKKLGSLYANGRVFYKEVSNKEILWNRAKVSINSWERNNFPPSLYGNGRVNPTQNLVNAFGTKSGYPIDNPSAGYDPSNPYANRDPRLADYIVYNTASLKSTPIKTFIGASQDGINVLTTSTRTGYYLKKLMLETVNCNPNSSVSQNHTYVFMRMTELLLNYAEAANEAWGPSGDPRGYGFSAKSLIGDLRKRAGITQPDAYLNSISDQASMRALIRNERRIELCFEGFRFWDIRRWNDVASMQASAKGVTITENAGQYTYDYNDVEERGYTGDMVYGPVPYNETLKYSLEQNKGW